MYTLSQSTKGESDLSVYFDDDLFNSSVIYQLSSLPTEDFQMSYKAREDLISSDAYSLSSMLGLVLVYSGPTVEVENGKVETVKGFEPLSVVQLPSLDYLRSSQTLTVTKNPLTEKEINPVRSPKVEQYKYSSQRFSRIS